MKFENSKLVTALQFAWRSAWHPRRVGTFMQTPSEVAERIANEVIGDRVVEFGAGYGAVTFKILEHLSPNGILYSFEIDPHFYRRLVRKKRDLNEPRLKLYCRGAEYLEDIDEIKDFHCIVSGLPLTSLEKPTAHKILESSQGAIRYIQYKYFPSDKLLEQYFSNVREERIGKIHVIYVCENPIVA